MIMIDNYWVLREEGRLWYLHWWGLQLLRRRACVAVVSAAVVHEDCRKGVFSCGSTSSLGYFDGRGASEFLVAPGVRRSIMAPFLKVTSNSPPSAKLISVKLPPTVAPN